MSLHALAKHMAAHGRGPDTKLVHMAPTELASLQDLAQRHGGSLTINPHTGLPEAGYLASLLPMALGAAAEFLPGMHGIGAGMVGAGIGAIHGLGSGSLSQGLLAGMSAYSGAGLAGGLLGSGIAVGNDAMQEQMKELRAAQAKAANKTLSAEMREAAEEQANRLSQQLQQAQTAELNKESRGFMDNLSTAGKGLMSGGFKNLYTSMGTTPGAFGPKTTLAAGAIPMALSGIEDSQTSVPAAKSTDSDRGAYANSGATFRPNWVGPYDNKTPGGEKTYAMPYYGADGGLTHMADGGMAEGGMPQRDAYQEYMDYLNQNLPSSGSAPANTPFKYATPEEIVKPTATATPEYLPQQGGTRGGLSMEQQQERDDPNSWQNQTPEQKIAYYANPNSTILGIPALGFTEGAQNLFGGTMLGRLQNYLDPSIQGGATNITAGARMRMALQNSADSGANLEGGPGGLPTVRQNAYDTGRSGDGGGGFNTSGGGNSGFNGSTVSAGSMTSSAPNQGPGYGGGEGGGSGFANGGGISDLYNLGSYSDGGRLLRGPGDGVSDSIPATIGRKQPARLADGEFVVPARIVSEIGNGSTEAGARKLYAMMDRVQKARGKTMGKGKVAKNSRADRYLPA